ncbi:hypothetical protein [Acidithiobacillus sulfurivorans]|uniref:Uncharacterized protein n=1 Tax=Acidithiobacillus sulfurivorans TaxID=1958756 RepID=A0ABS5ZZI2_9PROT|nr:hypothetical protein [Acidithiobacillus sulfurivorans]MBU2760584.1 hypothetical protein [Acidithiobacillus sulfurivorans]
MTRKLTQEQAEALAIAEKWEKVLSEEIAAAIIEPYFPTEAEREEVARSYTKAHDDGEVPDKDFARARIEAALSRWLVLAWEAAGKPEPVPDNITDGRPPIESVGVGVIDKALPLTCMPAHVFLRNVAYLLNESDDALEIAERRAKDCDKAARLLREAAELLRGADNEPLARNVGALAPWAERGKYGRVYPAGLSGGYMHASQHGDALSAAFAGKRGTRSRRGAVVRALAGCFTVDGPFIESGGFTIIAGIANLCEPGTTPNFVCSVMKQAKRTAEPKPGPRRDSSIIGLLSKPKI